jgi:hypothetical protein
MFFAGSIAYADDAVSMDAALPSQPVAEQPMAPVANVQLAAVSTAPIGQAKAPVADPLHADTRWPLFANCINNTATPDAFQACLQMAFLGTGPNDQVLALLTH